MLLTGKWVKEAVNETTDDEQYVERTYYELVLKQAEHQKKKCRM